MNAPVIAPAPAANQALEAIPVDQLFIPQCDRATFFAPKTDWLPRNEHAALALGKAQIATRRLDDQRILVLSAVISGDTAVLQVERCPDLDSIHGAHLVDVGEISYGRAMMGEGESAVLLEWAL